MGEYQSGSYQRDSFDWKRFALLNRRKMGVVIAVAMLGAFLFGGIYFLNEKVISHEETYRSAYLYHITFDREQVDNIHDYYNDYTWNDVLDSDRIAGVAATAMGGITKEEIAQATSIPTMSDIRFIWVYADAENKEKAEQIQNKIAEALLAFAEGTEGFSKIEIWDQRVTEPIEENFLLGRCMIAGFFFTFLVGLWVLWYQNAMDDSVYTESDFERQFGEKMAGTLIRGGGNEGNSKEELAKNLSVLLKDKKEIAVVGAYEGVDSLVSKEELTLVLPKETIVSYEELREDAAILWLVPFGKKDGARLEKCYKDLQIRYGKPAAVVLVDAEAFFYKMYYFGRKK